MRYNSDDWLCRNMMKNNANNDAKKDVQQKRLIPLWALVIGPLWIPVLLMMYAGYSIVFLVWVMPLMMVCNIFDWKLPKGIVPACFDDNNYEVMP